MTAVRMLAQKLNRPWAWFVAGAATLVVGLGYTGNLTSITAADRLLNPDARNYWESSAGYIQEVFDFCSTQAQDHRQIPDLQGLLRQLP